MDLEADARENAGSVGPQVKIIRVLYTGDYKIHTVPAPLAVVMALYDQINGGEVIRSRIVWGEVNSRDWDMSP